MLFSVSPHSALRLVNVCVLCVFSSRSLYRRIRHIVLVLQVVVFVMFFPFSVSPHSALRLVNVFVLCVFSSRFLYRRIRQIVLWLIGFQFFGVGAVLFIMNVFFLICLTHSNLGSVCELSGINYDYGVFQSFVALVTAFYFTGGVYV